MFASTFARAKHIRDAIYKKVYVGMHLGKPVSLCCTFHPSICSIGAVHPDVLSSLTGGVELEAMVWLYSYVESIGFYISF